MSQDPRIAPLRALFPDYDDLVLLSVLDSVNGDQDRAIDTLLGMSDPEYKADPAAPLSQTQLDEQYARQLLLEEQDAQQAAWVAHQHQMRAQPPPPPPPPQQQQQQQGTSDTMADIQQHIGKFAETGKKTINTLLNKVKAKIQDMDQPKTSTYDPAQYEQRTAQSSTPPQVPYAARTRTHAPPALAPAPAPQPAYYDPNPVQTQGYDTTPSDTQQQSPPIDGGKYGLLPKRPVTLLRPGETQRQHSQDDSDDGLEYAESPFEEKK